MRWKHTLLSLATVWLLCLNPLLAAKGSDPGIMFDDSKSRVEGIDDGYVVAEQNELTIWATNSTHKTMIDEPVPSAHADVVTLKCARNEYESVQIVLRSLRDITDVTVRMDDLVAGNGDRLTSDHLTLYLVHYVLVSQQTPNDPEGHRGYWPDPLVPYASGTGFGLERDVEGGFGLSFDGFLPLPHLIILLAVTVFIVLTIIFLRVKLRNR